MGLGRLELPTLPLSGVRSSQLSYRPEFGGAFAPCRGKITREGSIALSYRLGDEPRAVETQTSTHLGANLYAA